MAEKLVGNRGDVIRFWRLTNTILAFWAWTVVQSFINQIKWN